NMKLVGNPRLMYQHGQIHASQLRGDSPGDSLVYTAGFDGGKPDYLRPPDMPRWVSNEAGQLAAELDDIMHTHATSRGDVTFDRASGQALALLTEKDDSPLGIMAKDQQRGWSRLASMVLELYESKATERRSLNVTDDVDRHVAAVDWIGKDLRGQTNVHVPLESAMPSSPTAMMAFAREMWDRGAIKDITHFAKVAGLPLRDYTKVLDPDTARAQWENKRLLNGWAEVAEEFDNHAKHISEHNAARKSTAYRFADKKSRELIDGHIVMHQELALAEQEKQAALDEVQPGLSEVPQGAEPLGGSVPPSQQELEAAAASGLVPELGGPMAELQPNGAGGGLQNPTIPPGAATV
ncbi:MAG: hypothetical protein GY795_33175, partial [Desulfobacterales bacterium]|nr:hypothetical protein [Desulfobacterales bacterium]